MHHAADDLDIGRGLTILRSSARALRFFWRSSRPGIAPFSCLSCPLRLLRFHAGDDGCCGRSRSSARIGLFVLLMCSWVIATIGLAILGPLSTGLRLRLQATAARSASSAASARRLERPPCLIAASAGGGAGRRAGIPGGGPVHILRHACGVGAADAAGRAVRLSAAARRRAAAVPRSERLRASVRPSPRELGAIGAERRAWRDRRLGGRLGVPSTGTLSFRIGVVATAFGAAGVGAMAPARRRFFRDGRRRNRLRRRRGQFHRRRRVAGARSGSRFGAARPRFGTARSSGATGFVTGLVDGGAAPASAFS